MNRIAILTTTINRIAIHRLPGGPSGPHAARAEAPLAAGAGLQEVIYIYIYIYIYTHNVMFIVLLCIPMYY